MQYLLFDSSRHILEIDSSTGKTNVWIHASNIHSTWSSYSSQAPQSITITFSISYADKTSCWSYSCTFLVSEPPMQTDRSELMKPSLPTKEQRRPRQKGASLPSIKAVSITLLLRMCIPLGALHCTMPNLRQVVGVLGQPIENRLVSMRFCVTLRGLVVVRKKG